MRLNLTILLAVAAISASAQTYHRIDGTNIVQTSRTLPALADGVSRARYTQAHYAVGWHVEQVEDAPAGMVAQAWELVVVGDRVVNRPSLTTAVADLEAQAVLDEAERRATPIVYDQPIEVPILVLQTQTDLSRGVGLVVYRDEDGTYQTALYEQHASPGADAAEQKRRIADAITAHKAARKTSQDELAAIKADIKSVKEKVEKPR